MAKIPTEASAMALRCGRGAMGATSIREGRRTVHLTPAGALIFFFDPLVALRSAARCAQLVGAAGSLDEANAILLGAGIPTELAWEASVTGPPRDGDPATPPRRRGSG